MPFKDEFISELKFVAACHGNTKTVRHRKSTTPSMESKHADSAERASGRRSQSMDDHRSHDRSHSRADRSKELKA